jgi:hypothetical protein
MKSPDEFKTEEQIGPGSSNKNPGQSASSGRGKIDWWFIMLNVASTYETTSMIDYWFYDHFKFAAQNHPAPNGQSERRLA